MPIPRGFIESPFDDSTPQNTLPQYGRLRNFSNDEAGRKSAFRFGAFVFGTIAADPRTPPEVRNQADFAIERCKSLHIPLAFKDLGGDVRHKTQLEKNNSAGGFLVPDEFQSGMIDLRERYGVFRRNAKVVPMASDSRTDPRRRSGLTGYWPDEAGAIPPSDKSWDRVRLTAKKRAILCKISNELNEDAMINIADDLAGEIAYSFANTEDFCGFLGDGSSIYAGMVGVIPALKAVSVTPTSTISDVLGIYQTPHSSYATITLADFNQVVGMLPEFADTPNAKWYCSRVVYGSVMQRLATNSAGNRVMDTVGGMRQKEFLGYPVEVSQVLPRVYAANQIVALFGDLSLAAHFGERRQTTVALSEQFYFDSDCLALRGTERFDVNVHDVGENSNGTARDPAMGLTAGPIVALMLS